MKKKTLILAGLVLAAAALGVFFHRNALVDGKIYPRDTVSLDFRGQDISLAHYEGVSSKLPDAAIRWDVPFQGGTLADDTKELTVSSLTEEEADVLAAHLPLLRSVDGRECTSYDGLLRLKQLRPDVQVRYWVSIGGTSYASNAIQINLAGIAPEEIGNLTYLPQLRSVTLSGGEPEALRQLQTYCDDRELAIRLVIGGEVISRDAAALKLTGLSEQEASLLYLLPYLRALHLVEPEASPDTLARLREDLSGTAVSWEKTMMGFTFSHDVREIDLTSLIAQAENQKPGTQTPYERCMLYPIQGDPEEVRTAVKLLEYTPLPDKTADTAQLIEELEYAMGYFPEAEKLILCGSFLDNEAMAAFRERNADRYKVVWTVKCGQIATRTDATFFMPIKYHVYYLSSSEAYNLRYCPDLIAVDIGHMNLSDISFVEFMPQLRYLILAHTSVRDITPLRHCKNLAFLELDHTGVMDFSPLLECPSLVDLNIGKTWNDVEPLKQMTWLENLWMVFRANSGPEMVEALPDTTVVYLGTATVDCGWRDLPNYFAMRDELKMFYMTW